ncbi:hypothetical protein Vretifemale_1211 [Volvox reticuliferus]|uniref:Uncharacterized protein n=1 Tax=Volvox reticuliferus TaxID=1737510 RepID=A0A8J4BWB5_9CHLO|nr:hypothetical protein Vretifemale_1211 [Volvox reticuliferus]
MQEISGFFISVDKFASHVAALASPDCATRHLRLFHNEPHHTAAVVDALSRNASVTSLDIFELDPVAASTLATVLSASPRLASLAVHHPHGHEAVQKLCCGIAASLKLTSLHLSLLDARGVAALAAALLAWSSHLGAVSPSSAGVAALASVRVPRLRHLRLEKCAFTPNAAGALAEALSWQTGALSQLDLVDSDLGDAAAEALLAAPGWTQMSGSGSVLSSLTLSSCRIGLRGASQLGRLLASSPNLQSLNLANNKALGCEGARALAEGLARNRGLLLLDLSACGIGALGVEALAAALRPRDDGATTDAGSPPPPLQQLILGFNAVGSVGLAALLGAMSGPRTCMLRNLQLDHNRVRGVELAEALRGLATAAEPLPRVTAPLEQLSLAGNALYDDGVKVLAVCLAEAPCLEQLDLRENGISDDGVAALLPLIPPRGVGVRLRDGTQHPARGVRITAAGSPPEPTASPAGLQGLLLDGNRLHNAGAQALLAAVTAAPQLWRFSAEANKLTDPALRLSLTQLSQQRAARHSQLVVMGRYYSSSSSSSDDGAGGGRVSGGGSAAAEAADRVSGRGAGGIGPRRSHEATSPMDVDLTAAAAAGLAAGGSSGTQHHKHRLEDRDAAADGDQGGSGADRQPLRNVAARGADGTALPAGGCGDEALAVPASSLSVSQGGRQAASEGWCSLPHAGGGTSIMAVGRNSWTNSIAVPGNRDRSSGGSSSMDSGCGCDMIMLGTDGAAAASAKATPLATAGGVPLCTSPPPAMCFIRAISGVGGTTSVGVSKRVSAVGESDHPVPGSACKVPQQVLPACRRPRYKPLTPEQQRLFEDF